MAFQKKIVLLLCVLALCTIPVYSSASLPMINFPLKPSPASGPYQDEAFLEKVNSTIYGLSNQSVPNGTAILEIQSLQQQISKMNISPEFHKEASDINAFLFYTGKAGIEYQDAVGLAKSPYSPVSENGEQFNAANEYYFAAKKVWDRIKEKYPDVTLYTMTGGFDSGTTGGSLMYGSDDSAISSAAHTGLW